jgi:hypothetical protein
VVNSGKPKPPNLPYFLNSSDSAPLTKLAQEFEDVAQHTKAVLRSVGIEPVELEKTAAQGGVYFEKKNAPAGHKSECY